LFLDFAFEGGQCFGPKIVEVLAQKGEGLRIQLIELACTCSLMSNELGAFENA
jgi:hypothetical protein